MDDILELGVQNTAEYWIEFIEDSEEPMKDRIEACENLIYWIEKYRDRLCDEELENEIE